MYGYGFFIYDILGKFIPICEKRNDISRVNEYKEKQAQLKKNLNTAGWDGRWFKRAYMDNRRTSSEVLKMKNVELIVLHKAGQQYQMQEIMIKNIYQC